MKKFIVSILVVLAVFALAISAFACQCGGKGGDKGGDKGGGKYAPEIRLEASTKGR
jgi:hypothetical protein